MTTHTQVILILLAGLATLYLIFGTSIFIDYKRVLDRTREQEENAVPFWALFLGLLALGCVVFAAQYLILGTRPLPWPLRFSAPIFFVLFLIITAYKRRRAG